MPARHTASPRNMPDPIRITAGSAALLINALAALLLLQPQKWSELDLQARPDKTMTVVVIPRVVIPAPAPPAPPQQPTSTQRNVATPIPPPLLVPEPTSVLMARSVPAPVEYVADNVEPIAVAPVGGNHQASVDYAFAPPPPYPIAALKRGIEGTVWLRIEVDESGVPTKVTIERSSGNRALDSGARSHVLNRWRFQPARRDGQAVHGIALVPVDFRLDAR